MEWKIHWLPRDSCVGPAYRPQGLCSWQLCWPEYFAAIVEDPERSDEWQARGNCLSAATDSHIRYTYVSTEGPAYKEHFGAKDQNCSHWLTLHHAAGWWDLARFLFVHPEAACSAKRDATPLRLLSWLSFRLEPAVDELIEATMLHLSTVEEVKDSDLLALGTTHLEMATPFESAEALRDHLIELISVRNLRHRPEALFALFRQFLQRLTLPRLCHFLDLVLPQLTPIRVSWADATRTLWTCHHIRATSHDNGYPFQPRVTIPLVFGSTNGASGGCQSVSRPSCTSIASTAHPIRLEERHGGACVLPSPEWTPCERSFSGCPHCTRVCCESRKENRQQAVETGCPVRDRVCMATPDIAWAFCSDALRRRGDCKYLAFHEAHMGLQGRAFQGNIFIADMVFLGDTRSAEELAVFTNMAPERLCLGCGLRTEEKFTPIFLGERGPLLAASVKLLQFALRASSASASAKGLTEEEGALLQAIRPLVTNPDCHFLAVLTVLVQSVLEGRTDCPISGVFGAGKTRAAAAMIVGLLVMDPTLKVMVVTKENEAAHAFTKHIESLQLPPSLEEKFGRLVGVTELEKGPASRTKLDVLPGFRNTVLRTKQVIIGCGGGFHQECTQPYSPVARWMSEVDVALNDEGQQYGNLDEASAIARVPRKGLVVWCGDHKQTPGGLRKSYEARAFRRKLMRQLLHESTRQPLGLSTGSVAVFQELCQETIGRRWDAGITPCCCAAIAVLWLALAPERFPLQADTFSRAAGTAGKQKWSLILPSSARVSELTYVTIIGTRYPELDNLQNDVIQFGNYLQAEQCTRGGFLPIFWDAPYSYINASTDIGEVVDWIKSKFLVAKEGDLAVLHNRNKMVNAFATTEWVAGSGGAIISRSVTSCAGMTAYLVLLAQTRVGFLSGGRGKSFHQLTPQEQAAQKEEAFARATVALTRAQQICFIMGPLDMRGLVGAATIMGCLKYGACFSGLDDQDDPVLLIRLKDDDLLEAPDDSAFLQSLRFSCARVNGVYPPLAGVQFDVQTVWPLLAGVIPNDPSVAPPFVDFRESLENPVPEGVLEDDIPVFPSPSPIDPYPVAEPSAPSAAAAAPPSVAAPADDRMDVDLRGDDDDFPMEELGCIEDHCIHWYHQSVWNEFASIESCMEVGSTNTTFTEKFGGIDINVEVPSEVNDELTGLALDHSQVVEGMKTEVRQLESLQVGKNMTESEARKLATEKGVKIFVKHAFLPSDPFLCPVPFRP